MKLREGHSFADTGGSDFMRIGGARGFSFAWPAVRNREVYQGGTQRGLTTLWLDQTKAPFKK